MMMMVMIMPALHVEALTTTALPAPLRLQRLLREYSSDDGPQQQQQQQQHDTPLLLPCCYDGLTARLVARANFQATFLTGFGASAVHGVPDAQLLSYEEMRRTCDTVAEALDSVAIETNTRQQQRQDPIPCIAVRLSALKNFAVDFLYQNLSTGWLTVCLRVFALLVVALLVVALLVVCDMSTGWRHGLRKLGQRETNRLWLRTQRHGRYHDGRPSSPEAMRSRGWKIGGSVPGSRSAGAGRL